MTTRDPRPPRRSSGILSGPIDAPPADRLATVYPLVPAAARHGAGPPGQRVQRHPGPHRGRRGRAPGPHRPGAGLPADPRGVRRRRQGREPGPGARRPSARRAPVVTASGSVAVAGAPARVARAGRIWVEGVHDAELVERVWGDDLRIEGVVVERLDGIDHLDRAIADVPAGAGPPSRASWSTTWWTGSKESRIAEGLRRPDVLITGTPFVDVWQAVRPSVLGIEAWPHIPKGTEWKAGVCAALGFGDPPAAWRRILAVGVQLRRPRAGAGRRRRAADRLRHRPPTEHCPRPRSASRRPVDRDHSALLTRGHSALGGRSVGSVPSCVGVHRDSAERSSRGDGP